MQTTKNLEIERLRAVAIILVFFFHSPTKYNFDPVLTFSFTGVDLFFVISGFVVMGSMLRREMPTDGSGKFEFIKNFYLRRLFRIAPASLFWAAIYVISTVVFPNAYQQVWGSFSGAMKEFVAYLSGFYNYLLVSGAYIKLFPHYWSLAVEEHFYLVAPFLLVTLTTVRARALACAVGIIVPMLVFRSFTAVEHIYNSTHTRFDSLCIGVALALFFSLPQTETAIARTSFTRYRWALNLLSLGLVGLLFITPGLAGEPFRTKIGINAYNLYAAMLVSLAALQRGAITGLPGVAKIMEYLGSRSYSFYLCHIFFINVVTIARVSFFGGSFDPRGMSMPAIAFEFCAGFGLSILGAELTYRLVEKPMLAVGKRFIGETRES